ncbi:MAG: hypothetical protein K8J08_01905 [Thermoanaerobaculia bacterium]|nr:hypothetical protein [Thermoanaerobaculia bacterium]
MRPSVLSLVLNAEWQAALESGRARQFGKRISLLDCACTGGLPFSVDDTLFPSDGSHYRPSQLYTLWSVFGVSGPIVPSPRFLGRIEELVENRNAISHGRRTAHDVGRGYSRGDIEARIDDTRAICVHVVGTLQSHVVSGALVAR